MSRYFIKFSYDGTDFFGWQKQNDARTVQEELEKALRTVLRDKSIALTGAGRTDTGVHALMMVAHFDTENALDSASRIVKNLNSLLTREIAVDSLWLVADDMHARFSAKKRTYKYYVTMRKNPFLTRTTTYVMGDLDFDAMNAAAEKLLGYSDFTSFSKLHTSARNNLCSLTEARWEQASDGIWVFTITANRFLRNMVRAVVGTLFEVGRHKITVEDFCKIVDSKDRCKAGTSAPPNGLFLTNIEY